MTDLTNTIQTGDCFDVLEELPAESVHAVVTDPPYGLAFMGRDWDQFEPKEYQEWCEDWATEAKRVLKPGGHLLAFSGNRTHHRLFSGVEDAGYEVRDTLTWHYGCLSEDTEVLTPDGWRSHDEVAEGDGVVAFDPDTETLGIEQTNRVFRYDHDGQMVRFKSPHTDQLVTPNHRVLHRVGGRWKTSYATRSNGIMEVPVIRDTRKSQIRLPGDEKLSDMLLGLGGNDLERGGKQTDLLAGVRSRTPCVGPTRGVQRPTEQTAGRTRRDCGGELCQLWRNGLDIQEPCRAEGAPLLRPSLLRRVEKYIGTTPRTPARDSTERRTVRGVLGTPVGADEWREQPGVERWRDRKEAEGELQARDSGTVSRRVRGNGASERLRSGASVESGEGTGSTAHVGGSGTPQGPRQPQQRYRESGTLAEQQTAQVGRRQPRGVSVGTTLARTTRVDYSGTVWCVQVPSSYFVARRNGQVFITGNSGFPKSLDVSKSIDKQADAEREVVGVKPGHEDFADRETTGHLDGDGGASEGWRRPWMEADDAGDYHKKTSPATDAAEKWDGWKTALKPATEFVVLARKPLSEGTVAENVQTHGTGALNIDETRISTDDDWGDEGEHESIEDAPKGVALEGSVDGSLSKKKRSGSHEKGRYPPNVVFDEQAAERLDREVGELDGGTAVRENVGISNDRDKYGEYEDEGSHENVSYDNGGGPSRYFYTSKATKSERTLDGRIANAHPTVKPQDLMEWLVKLATAEGQTVLDPFAGSGTTCAAAKDLGREFLGIEKQAKWADVARVRVGLTPEDPARVRSDDAQEGLEAFAVGGGSDG